MKIFNFKAAVCVSLIAGFIVVSPALGDRVSASEYTGDVQTPDTAVLKKIDIVELPASTQILLEAGNSLKYTSFTLMDPPRLVIDLPGVSLGEFTKPITVGKGAVVEIVPVEADLPLRVARLSIKLAIDVKDPQIFSKSNVLIIEIPSTMPARGADKATAVPPLNMVRELIFNETGDKSSIRIVADNEINADAFIVEGDKLVVDVKDSDNSIKSSEKVVESSLISKIRIGNHPAPSHKVRFVADLKKAVKYEVNKQGREITIDVYSKGDKGRPKVQLASIAPVPVGGDGNPGDTNSAVSTTEKTPAASEKSEEVVAPKTAVQPVAEQPQPPKEKKSATPSQTANVTPEKKNGQNSVKKVSLDFQDADIVNVLRLLAEVSKLNMIIGDNVKGKITIKMLDVPWDQALNIILKMKGLGKIYENNVVRIDTLVNIAQQQEEEARAKDAMVKAEDLSTKIIPVNYAKAKEVADSIKKTLSSRGDMTIDDRTNTLIVKDVADKHEEIVQLLKTLDRPTPQVLIEARIVQADSNFAKDLGVQWGGNYTSSPGDYTMSVVSGPSGTVGAPTTGFAVNLPASGLAGSKGSVGFTIGKTVGDAFNLDLRLSAGETKGLTKILSAPKIATLDNREAIIQQGESIPYKTYSQEGTKTEFIDATLTLKVIPKVTPDGHISMNIKITKNRQGSIVVEGTPSINKKEATTEVLVRDGETTVIGGIYELSDTDNENMIPWIHKVPVLGWLFKNTSKSNIKSELLIFITPKIIPVTS
ncbi:MAG: type IV pilus secretin PilQ [Nitrospirae bacterium]|nr:type IV pilus secretin PilQ [Nitrospirota bacterium]